MKSSRLSAPRQTSSVFSPTRASKGSCLAVRAAPFRSGTLAARFQQPHHSLGQSAAIHGQISVGGKFEQFFAKNQKTAVPGGQSGGVELQPVKDANRS